MLVRDTVRPGPALELLVDLGLRLVICGPSVSLAAESVLATVVWFFLLRDCWRYDVPARLLGLSRAPGAPLQSRSASRDAAVGRCAQAGGCARTAAGRVLSTARACRSRPAAALPARSVGSSP